MFLFLQVRGDAQVLISLLFGDKLNSGNIEFGLTGGFSSSSLTGIEGSKNHSDFNLGFYFDIKTKKPDWTIYTGVRVKSTLGADAVPLYSLDNASLDAAFVGGDIIRKIQYFHVPMTLKYQFKNKIFVDGGIQLGLRYKATDFFENDIDDKDDLTFKNDVRYDYHPLEGGLIAGLGYRLSGGNGMNVGIQYYYGVIDVRISDATANQFNRCWYINADIPIGKGKAEAKVKE